MDCCSTVASKWLGWDWRSVVGGMEFRRGVPGVAGARARKRHSRIGLVVRCVVRVSSISSVLFPAGYGRTVIKVRGTLRPRVIRDRLRSGHVSAVANRLPGGDKSGTPQGPPGHGLLDGFFAGAGNVSFGRPVRTTASAAVERRPNRAPAVTPTMTGDIFVSLEAFEEQLDTLGLRLEGRLGKGSRAQVFDVVSTTDAHGWKAGQSLAVKALVGEFRSCSPPPFVVSDLHRSGLSPSCLPIASPGQVQAAAVQEMKNEVQLWTPLQDDGIVKLYYSSLSPVPLLVLEACDGGTLFAAYRRASALLASPPPPRNLLAALSPAGRYSVAHSLSPRPPE